MDNFSEKLNLLHVSKVGKFLPKFETKYIIKPFSEDEFIIIPKPPVFFGKFKDIYDYLCYDYDELPAEYKEKYSQHYQSFEKVDGNLYKLSTKIYNFKQKKKQ